MKIFGFIIKVFKSYRYSDWIVSGICLMLILLMFLKMVVFPYGMFNFGESDIYTEAVVSKNGIQNINPLFVDYNEADREVSRLVFSGLMKYDPQKKAVVDDMAALTINNDKTEYLFTLRDGIKWHDGTSVTIDDVYFTFHDIIQSESFQNEILKTNFAGVEITKVAENQIKFTLAKPNTFFATNFTVGILPKHKLKDVDPYDLLQDQFNKSPVGTGPYMMEDSVEAFSGGRMQVILKKNPAYYGDIPQIENMRIISFTNIEELLDAPTSVDGIVKVTGMYVDDFKETGRFTFSPYELPQYTAVFMNMESEVLKDKKIRGALLKAVDKSAIMKLLSNKVVVDMPITELEQKEFGPKYDQQASKEDLYAAGYAYAKEDTEHTGVRYASDDEPLVLNLISISYDEGTEQYEEVNKLLSFLEKSWIAVGCSAKIELLSPETFKERLMKRDYDMAFVRYNVGYNFDTYSYWHSTQAGPTGQNFSNLKSFRIDTLIEDIRSTFDQDAKLKKLAELAQNISDEIPAIFLYRSIYYYASDGKVDGVNMEGVVFPSDRYFGIAKWKFKK